MIHYIGCTAPKPQNPSNKKDVIYLLIIIIINFEFISKKNKIMSNNREKMAQIRNKFENIVDSDPMKLGKFEPD